MSIFPCGGMVLRLLLLVAMTLSALAAVGQSTGKPGELPYLPKELCPSPSPEAASLAKYVDMNVDHSTGSMHTSVPIAEWTVGSMPLSVSLSYATGAVRTDERAGSVGIGWSLTCGGVITRSVVGFPDELKQCIPEPVYGGAPLSERPGIEEEYLISVGREEFDSALDRYSYSIPGYSGTFYILPDRSIRQFPKSAVKIELLDNLTEPTPRFRITSPDGVVHIFSDVETSEVNIVPPSLSAKNNERHYSYVSAWHLSTTISSEHADTVNWFYTKLPDLVTSNYRNDSTWTFSQSIMRNAGADFSPTDGRYTTSRSHSPGTNEIIHSDRRIPLRIESRTATVSFTHKVVSTDRANESRHVITGVTLRNSAGTLISSSQLTYGSSLKHEPVLTSVQTTRNDTIVDRQEFTYTVGKRSSDGADIFGHHNNTRDLYDSHNVYRSDKKLNPNCTSDSAALKWWTLKSMRDIMGNITEIEYEPAIVRHDSIRVKWTSYTPPSEDKGPYFEEIIGSYEGSEGSVIYVWYETRHYYFAPQIRVKSILVTDCATQKWRKREFTYEGASPTVDIDMMSPDWFRSLSGSYTMSSNGRYQSATESLSATLGRDSRLPGMSISSAAAVHSKVTETVTGTDLSTPFVTERTYDISPALHQPVSTGRSPGNTMMSNEPRRARFLGMNPRDYAGDPLGVAWIFDPAFVSVHFREQIGGKPLLFSQSEIRGSGNRAITISRTDYSWFVAESDALTVSTYVEPIIYHDVADFVTSDSDNLKGEADFQHFPVMVKSDIWLCDSVVETEYFANHLSRQTTTLQAWNGYRSRWENSADSPTPPQRIFSRPTVKSPDHTQLRKSRTITPTATIERHMLYAANLRGDDAEFGNLLTRPATMVTQAWINGVDTILSQTSYRLFHPTGNILPLPSLLTFGHKGAEPADRISFEGYSDRAHPTGIIRNYGTKRVLQWGIDGDCLTADSIAGIPGTRRYSYAPLVGCTSIAEPYGKVANYGYHAGRLSKMSDTNGNLLSEWSYAMMGCQETKDDPSGRNYITMTTYGDPGGAAPKKISTYFDSFGNQFMTRDIDGGGYYNNSDIITALRHDALGRVNAEWMLFKIPSSKDLPYDEIESEVCAYHGQNSIPARKTTYDDASFTSSVIVREAGQSMQGRPMVTQRYCNSSSGERACTRWKIFHGAACPAGNWAAGALDVSEITDGDGHKTLTFTDQLGNKLLERRVISSNNYADTYFIYDNLNRLTVVLPPQLVALYPNKAISLSSSDFKAYGYRYVYDKRMLLTSKKLPGAEEILYGYDKTNTQILRSDGLLRENGLVEYNFYDKAGRPAVKGTAKRDSVTGFENKVMYVSPRSMPGFPDKSGLSQQAIGPILPLISEYTYMMPVGLKNEKRHKTLFYDNYSFLTNKTFTRVDSIMKDLRKVKVPSLGAPTGEITAIFADSLCPQSIPEYVYSATRYDVEGRPVETVATHIKGLLSQTKSTYSIDGKTLSTTTRYFNGSCSDAITHDYTYDNSRREIVDRLSVSRTTPSGQRYTDSYDLKRQYSDLGRLCKLTPATEEPYYIKYNMRGQVVQVHSLYLVQELYYETGGKKPRYNGGISAIAWRHYGMKCGNEGRWRYDYTYDELDRLIKADFSQTSGDADAAMAKVRDYSCSYTYDLNSNITSLTRKGPVGTAAFDYVDRLTMTLNGNQTTAISDAATEVLYENSLDFHPVDGGSSSTCTYDTNGNLLSDTSRGIKSITYNPIGLPMTVDRGDGKVPIHFVYDADGNRLAYLHNGGVMMGGPIGSRVAPSDNIVIAPDFPEWEFGTPVFRYYLGPITYENDSLQRIDCSLGYIAGRKYHAIYPDYQGNTRVVISNRQMVQTNNYYPYGLPFAENKYSDVQPIKYGGKELITDKNLGVYDFHARMHRPVLGNFSTPDANLEDYYPISPYCYCIGNPIENIDPDGRAVNVIIGAGAAAVGCVVGAAIEATSQIISNGTISDWRAVGGASAQGAITGLAAGLTCGASLGVTVSVASASNIVGGTVNREIQDKETTATDIVTDAAIGGVSAGIGQAAKSVVKASLDKASNHVKGKIGEATTKLKYNLMGYKSRSTADIDVATGRTRINGTTRQAKYDFDFRPVFGEKRIVRESKFGTSRLTRNQKEALPTLNAKKIDFAVDRTTSTGLGSAAKTSVQIVTTEIDNRLNNK